MAAKKANESEVKKLYYEGKTSEEIASELGLSTKAVSESLKSIEEKTSNELFIIVNRYIETIDSNIVKIEEIMDNEHSEGDLENYKKTEKLWLENITTKMRFIKDREQLSNVIR